METEQLVQKLPSNDLTNQVTFIQEGRFLASAGSEITLWDIQEGRCVKTLVTDSMPADNELKLHTHYEAIACSPDGKYLAAVLRSTYHNSKKYDPNQPEQTEVIEIWDTEQGVVVKTLVLNNQETITRLQYSPDGQYLASGKIGGAKYPAAIKSWEDNWDILSTFYAYPPAIRRIIYTTNIIEGLNRQFRKVTKTKSSFPNDDSLRKMLYLASNNIVKKWTQRYRDWDMVLNHLVILFEDRYAI